MEYTYEKYAEDVENGYIVVCDNIRLAVERYREFQSRDDIYFDENDVQRKLRFISKMKHTKGQFNGKNFIMLPWQQFVMANIFGWKYKSDNTRVTKKVLLLLSRKSGKTAMMAAICLCCMIADGEIGGECDFVANSKAQAAIALEHCQDFASSIDPQQKLFKQYRNEIRCKLTKSKIQVLASDSMGLDGYNASLFLVDEFHAAKTLDLYNVMKSSQGSRLNPLALVISTAGFLVGNQYPLYSYRETCINILKGLSKDDSQFTMLFELDEDDDWQDEDVWEKCQPSLNQTVNIGYMRDEVNSAINNTSLEVGVKTKTLNIFCQSANTWIPEQKIVDVSEDIDLSKLKNETCFCGVDLSAISDLTAYSLCFPPNEDRSYYPDKYIFKTFIYIPQVALEESSNATTYKSWKYKNLVRITSGNVTDYDEILNDQIEVTKDLSLYEVAYDSWNASQYATNATNAGLPMKPFSQSLGNFSAPTKLLELLIRSDKCVIDNNEVIRWMFSNIELKTDWNDNIKPIKSGNIKYKKIDGVISMIESLGSCTRNMGIDDTEIIFLPN